MSSLDSFSIAVDCLGNLFVSGINTESQPSGFYNPLAGDLSSSPKLLSESGLILGKLTDDRCHRITGYLESLPLGPTGITDLTVPVKETYAGVLDEYYPAEFNPK